MNNTNETILKAQIVISAVYKELIDKAVTSEEKKLLEHERGIDLIDYTLKFTPKIMSIETALNMF